MIDGPRSLVIRQGHNRMHSARGLLAFLMGVRPMTTKVQRQQAIAKLIGQAPGHQPAAAARPARGEGIAATQATVSRDLEDLGAVKVRVPGGDTVYAIPEYEPHGSRRRTSCGG